MLKQCESQRLNHCAQMDEHRSKSWGGVGAGGIYGVGGVKYWPFGCECSCISESRLWCVWAWILCLSFTTTWWPSAGGYQASQLCQFCWWCVTAHYSYQTPGFGTAFFYTAVHRCLQQLPWDSVLVATIVCKSIGLAIYWGRCEVVDDRWRMCSFWQGLCTLV
jgi:hypothetical protein